MYKHRASVKLYRILIILIGLNACFSSYAAGIIIRKGDAITYQDLKFFEQAYPQEIYDYCTEKYLVDLYELATCLDRQASMKNNILRVAQDQLGLQSLAQLVYDDCLEYYPATGMGRIVACVKTRLMLNSKIENFLIEKEIHQSCEMKWRKHGFKAVQNCCLHSGNYYLRFGEIRK